MKKVYWLLIMVAALLLLTLVDASPLASQDQANNPEANKAVLTAFWSAEAARDYDRINVLLAEDFVRHSVATSAVMPDVQITNREQYVQFLKGTAATFPDYYDTPQMLVAEGNYVAFYTTFSGTFAQNGNKINIPLAGYARFANGTMAELWVEWDNVTMNTQMMATPAAPTEQPISGIEDVVGIWNVFIAGEPYLMSLTPNGQLEIVAPQYYECGTQGHFAVESGAVRFLASGSHPAASYQVFVTKDNGTPASLRFALDGDDGCTTRREMLDGQTILRVMPVERPVTTADLIGAWKWRSGAYYLVFHGDETYGANDSLSTLNAPTMVEDSGRFQLENGLLTMTSGAATRYCSVGDVNTSELTLLGNGVLQTIEQKDDCFIRRAPSSNPQLFDRVN